MSAVLTREQFIAQLSACGLMSADEVSSFQQENSAQLHSDDPKEFAQALVQQGLLTRFQAANVLHGKTKSLVMGEYVILDRLGQGGMGIVVKARHRRMDRLVAIKVLSSAAMKSPSLVRRFYREVRAAARLIHPNIVMAYDAGEHEGMHYLVMELVEGPNLARLVSCWGPLPVSQALKCIQQAAQGLQYAHSHGVIHRDIKPGNLLISDVKLPEFGGASRNSDEAPTADGDASTTVADWNSLSQPASTVKILDMGLALITSGITLLEDGEERLTTSGLVMGTCDYMAPEQAENAHNADHRADIYALGCTLYRLLTGKPPYAGETLVHLLLAHQKAPIPSLRASRSDIPEEVDAVYQKMLAKRPDDRYQSMTEVMEALAACSLDRQAALFSLPAAKEPVARATSPSSPVQIATAEATPLPTAPQHAAPQYAQETFAIQVEQPTKERRSHGHKPGATPPLTHAQEESPSKLILGIGGGLLALALLLAVLLVGVVLRRTKEPALAQDEPAPSVAEPGDAERVDVDVERADTEQGDTPSAVQPAPEAASTPAPQQDAAPALKLAPSSAVSWQAAWDAADAQAKKLLKERRFGAAVAELQTLLPRFNDPSLQEQVSAAVQGITAQAEAAYRSAEVESQQLLADERFVEARAVLQPVLELHAWPATTEAARAMLLEIDRAEQAAGSPAPPEKPAAMPPLVSEPATEPPQEPTETPYEVALRPIEALAAAWDFRQAAAAADDLSFESPQLAARLAQRRDDLRRLDSLKAKIVARIRAAEPRLDKTTLMLRGINGEVSGADDRGIAATLPGGKSETHPWAELSDKSRSKLLQLTVDRENADDWVAAGLLTLVCKDPVTAEKCFDTAASRGFPIAPYLEPLAAAAFVQVRSLLESDQPTAADALLTTIEKKYAATDWLEVHRTRVADLRKIAHSRIVGAEAEGLFAEALKRFEKREWFELQPLVDRLKRDYPATPAVTDAQRQPNFGELEQAVADLGKQLVVSADGAGDYRSIQEAIDAAPPKSIIEIRSPGPFYEKLLIPASRPGLTLRGGNKGVWPLICSGGPAGTISELITIAAPDVTLEHLLVVHASSAGSVLRATHACRVRQVLFAGRGTRPDFNAGVDSDTVVCVTEHSFVVGNGPAMIRNSVFLQGLELNGTGAAEVRNVCIAGTGASIRRPASYAFCTVAGPVTLSSAEVSLSDSVITGTIKAEKAGCRIEHCNTVASKFVDFAKPGVGCLAAPPQFADPKNFDYRLLPTSPCLGRASDGGDLGVRWTPEMRELLNMAISLRQQGAIQF